MTRIIKVVALDNLTADYFNRIVEERNDAVKVWEGLSATGLWSKNDKGTLEPDLYTYINRRFQDARDFPDMVIAPGGSAANTLTTAARALRPMGIDMHLSFISTVSNLPSGEHIKTCLKDYGNISILPQLPVEQQAQVISPSSYVFLDETGKKYIAKGKGFGNSFITTEHINNIFRDGNFDIAFFSGSTVEKFSYAVARKFLYEARARGCKVIYALPTEITPENKKLTEEIINDGLADIICSNTDELQNYYNQKPAIGDKPQPLAFISDGAYGANVLLPDGEWEHIGLWNKNIKVTDTTGAGDNFNAGAIAGLLLGYAPRIAGHFGAAMSSAVIQQVGAQLHTIEPNLVIETAIQDCYQRGYLNPLSQAGSHIINPTAVACNSDKVNLTLPS